MRCITRDKSSRQLTHDTISKLARHLTRNERQSWQSIETRNSRLGISIVRMHNLNPRQARLEHEEIFKFSQRLI